MIVCHTLNYWNIIHFFITGKISRSGHPLQPLSQHEHDFCDTAMNMHEEFQKDSEIRDITLR